jgi:hypothetical protein
MSAERDASATGSARHRPDAGRAVAGAFALNVLLMVGGIVWVFWLRHIAGAYLYHSNFEAFHNVLTEEQREGIIFTVRELLAQSTAPLITTNVILVVLVLLARFWRSNT